MAYNKYKNKYSKSLPNKIKIRNLSWLIVAVVVLVVLLFVLLKGDGGENVAKSNEGDIPQIPSDVKIEDPDGGASSGGGVVDGDDLSTGTNIDGNTSGDDTNIGDDETAAVSGGDDDTGEDDLDTGGGVDEDGGDESGSSGNGTINIPLSKAQELMTRAATEKQSGKIAAARDTLNEVLALDITPLERERIKTELSQMANMWLFSRSVFPGDKLTGAYLVQSGDNLGAIGARYKVPAEFIMKINGIENANRLRADQSIKIVHGPFNAVVNKAMFTLDVYLQNTYVTSYRVGTGLPGKDTPTGKWKVKIDGKLIQPPWPNPEGGGMVYANDPEYPLGSRWIGIEGIQGDAVGRTGFGLHGTKDPETIGTQSSQGCVRLYNEDVIDLYNMLTPEYSEVWIR